MQLLGYLIAYPFIWLISILPFRLLYLLSDIIYILLYKLIGYRKKTVRENLKLALPDLTPSQHSIIEKKFYKHLCDSFMEMAKTMSITDRQMRERFTFTNLDLLHDYEAKNKSVMLFIGHYGSYEWLLSMNKYLTSFKGYGIYKAIRNKYFNALVKKIRKKFNAELISTKNIIPAMRQNRRQGIHAFYGFISDQTPKEQSIIYWGKFFGIDVPMQVGGEILAKKLDMNVMYARVEKTGRGFYRCTFVPFESNPKAIPDFEITDWFMKLLEDQIKDTPEFYLWTHKRFKHRNKKPKVQTTL